MHNFLCLTVYYMAVFGRTGICYGLVHIYCTLFSPVLENLKLSHLTWKTQETLDFYQ